MINILSLLSVNFNNYKLVEKFLINNNNNILLNTETDIYFKICLRFLLKSYLSLMSYSSCVEDKKEHYFQILYYR